METLSSSSGDQFAGISRPAGLRFPRILQPRRMPHQRQELDRGDHHPEALKTKNLTLFDRAQVTRIVTAPDGRASGVHYLRDGKEYFQPARAVLLASYTYENTRLLLLSKSGAFPQGLANNHGQVGKHYFGHWSTGVTALFPFDINVWYGTPAQAAAVDDWADDQLRPYRPRIHRRHLTSGAH